MALEIEEQKLLELTEALEFLQLHSKVRIEFQGRKEEKCVKAYAVGKGRSIGMLLSFVASLLGFFHLAWDLWLPM